ncbi:hypothetical protein [Nonomuraea sp. NPDC050691]
MSPPIAGLMKGCALAQEGVGDGMHVRLTADQEIESEIDLILERTAG